MAKKVTPKNFERVLDNLKEIMKKARQSKGIYSKESLKIFCEGLNNLLDEWADDDAFGTEKQCDPRGDQRG